MKKLGPAILVAAMISCGGDSGTGPTDANVTGTWIVTFSATAPCSLSQLSLTLSRSPSGAPLGNHGSYVISCTGLPDAQEDPGTVATWAVSGDNFSLHVTTSPARQLVGTVTGGTITGNFTWLTMAGTFTAVRQ